MISELLEKIIGATSERGVPSFIRPLRRIIPRFLFETKCVQWDARELDTFDVTIETDIPVDVSFTDFEETLRWIQSLDVDELLSKRELRVAKLHGHYWGNAKHAGNIIGCIKVTHGRVYIPDFKKTIRLPEGVGYITDVYLLPQYRGKRIGPWLMAEGLFFMKRKGFKKEIGFIEFWNQKAHSAKRRVTFTREKPIRYVRILGCGFFLEDPVNLCFETRRD